MVLLFALPYMSLIQSARNMRPVSGRFAAILQGGRPKIPLVAVSPSLVPASKSNKIAPAQQETTGGRVGRLQSSIPGAVILLA